MSTPTTESPSSAPERKGFYVKGWILAVVGVVVVLAAAVAIGLAVGDGGGGERGGRELGGPEGGFQHHGGEGHGLRIVVLLILIALAIAGAVFLIRRNAARSADQKTSAEEILAERFARGEIDEADYRSRRNALRG
jgi:putative membrane protein